MVDVREDMQAASAASQPPWRDTFDLPSTLSSRHTAALARDQNAYAWRLCRYVTNPCQTTAGGMYVGSSAPLVNESVPASPLAYAVLEQPNA